MKLSLEKYLYPIDQSFAQKKPNEILMTYVLIAAILFAFSYFLFWDSAEKEYNSVHQARIAIEKKLTADEQYLKLHPESEIKSIDDQILKIKNETLATKEKNEYINFKISQISELFYNEKAWGKYLDSIAENARKYRVKLSVLENKKAVDTAKFGHVLDIKISATGSYRNLVKFINSMEQSNLVIDLHGMNLQAKQQLMLDVNSSVWGITY